MAYDYGMAAGWLYGRFEWLIEGLTGAPAKGINVLPSAPWGFQS